MKVTAPVDGTQFDAIVIGAGYGGVSCAAVLASRGMRVLVVDKNAKPGGKAMPAARSDGVTTELWPVAGGPAYGTRFEDLMDLVGLSREVIIAPEKGANFVYIDDQDQQHALEVSSQPIRNPLLVFSMARAFGVPVWKMLGLLRMNLHSMRISDAEMEEYDRVSMLDYMKRFHLPAPVLHWLSSLMNLFFVVPVDQLPASEAILTLRGVAKGGAGRYHRGGYGVVAQAAVDYVVKQQGVYLPSTRVNEVLVEGGRAVGISTPHGCYFAPVVISNAGIQPTVFKLVGEGAFPAGYVQRVKEYVPSWAFVGVRYDLSRPFFKIPMNVYFSSESGWDRSRFAAAEAGQWPHNPLLFVTVPSLYDPSLVTPEVAQVALIGVLCSPDPDSPMNAQATVELEKMVDRLWPEFRSLVTRRKVYGADAVSSTTRDNVLHQGGECIGLGQLIGQCGRSKPDFRAPLQGLYYAGTDAGGRGIGTTQAVDSGWNVAHAILEDYRKGVWKRPTSGVRKVDDAITALMSVQEAGEVVGDRVPQGLDKRDAQGVEDRQEAREKGRKKQSAKTASAKPL
ncbi:Similar to phytoene dehydrogenase [gamma proteobacterium HdN1]|nr:Similar to phytoene dehydrogenase [gamma proteobacterium HdN1]